MILTKRNKEEMTLLINVQSLGLHIVYESFQAVYKKLMEEVEQVIKLDGRFLIILQHVVNYVIEYERKNYFLYGKLSGFLSLFANRYVIGS